ncbi:MAG TPA: isochorismatase family protein [Caulobacteraceae bacterium]|jgi:nicotinamidase-related amidase|nr:isochorismatase family protein [Caulobacteraceae bacterium]
MSETSAVLVVDLQTGLIDGVAEPPIHDAAAVIERAKSVIAWAREHGRKVAFVRHDGPPGDSLAPGAPGWAVWPALGQGADEPTFGKNVGDAFSEPALGDWIDALGADALILLGAQSDHCIAATLGGALARGLTVTVVGDAHSTCDCGGETAAAIIERQNHAFAEAGATVITAAELTAS